MRSLPLLATALMLAGPALASPLCRDTKGLFTPCPKAVNDAWRAKKAAKEQADKADAEADAAAPATAEVVKDHHGKTHTVMVRHHTKKPELFGIGKLCRDSKGLATPCPR